jgi:hypothetical protein
MRDTTAFRSVLFAGIAAAAVLACPADASADEVKPTAKGIAGCALLGGEVVVFGEAIFGVRSPAAYLIGAGAGAVAGGVGGFFLEKGVSDGRIPAYTLAGGLALIIPALVVAFDQTRYMPSEGAREDKNVPVGPPAEPGKPGGGSVVGAEPGAAPAAPSPGSTTPATPATPAPATPPAGGGTGGGTPAPQSLIDVRLHEARAFRMGAPIPAIRPMFTVAEENQLAVKSTGTELRFPVVHVTF